MTALSGSTKALLFVPDPSTGVSTDFALAGTFSNFTPGGYLTEPTIAHKRGGVGDPSSERVFGFLRTQSIPFDASRVPAFYHSSDAAGSIAQQTYLGIPIAARSPIPCAYGDDGKIYAFCSERLTDYSGDAEVRAVYLLVAKASEALRLSPAPFGASAFTVYQVGDVDILAQSEELPPANAGGPGRSSEASNTGLPTVVKHGSWIIFFYEDQEYGAFQNSSFENTVQHSWTNIKYFAIDTRNRENDGEYPLTPRGVLGA